jgi:hypothetical protein
MTLRLSDEQAAELEAMALVEGVPIAKEIRKAIAEHIASRRNDRAFQDRLKASLRRHRELLQRLAKS